MSIKTFVERCFFCMLLTFSIVALSTIGAVHGLAGPRINVTPSIPRGLYLYVPGSVHRGEIVQVCLPPILVAYAKVHQLVPSGICPGHLEPIVKVLVALPGDTVSVREDGVRINNALWPLSAVRTVDEHGRHIDMHISQDAYIVAPAHVFLLGLNAHSWDSRYFGALPTSTVSGRWYPLFTEKGPMS